mgnify:CR=1 FL=1
MNLSQEELAEKIYVTRQTISNWENDKSYPDIHSLLLLSSTFHISLDQLIKGDITTMKEEISKEAKTMHTAVPHLPSNFLRASVLKSEEIINKPPFIFYKNMI